MRALTGILAVLAVGATLSATAQAPAGAAADLIFTHGVIYTGEGLAEDRPRVVSAMAIGGGKVLAVGTEQDVMRLAGPKTLIRNLNSSGGSTGVFVFPGFNDSHVHLGDAGRIRMSLDLTGVKSEAEMMVRVETFAKTTPPARWITGGNWDPTLWPDKILPTREELDRVTNGHPAFLARIDGHIAIANSAALEAAGISRQTKAPAGGAIDLDASGEPTGILRESAQGVVERVIPQPGREERRRGDELAIAEAVMHGVTSVQDFSDWGDFLVFEELEQQGKLNVRVSEWLPFKAPLEELKQMRAHHDANDPMLHTGMLKGFLDGSLGSRTAALKAPYSDDPGDVGLPQYTQPDLNRMAEERFKAGFQLGFHAIGDKAVMMALTAISATEAGNVPGSSGPCPALGEPYEVWNEKMPCPRPGSPREQEQIEAGRGTGLGGAGAQDEALVATVRNRIEHAQVVDPFEISLFKQLGVIASMQPSHLLTDMNWAEARLGPKRAAYSYAWKSFLDAGVPLAFGTDYPVEPITPFRGLYAAVTRMNEAGTKSYFPEQKITRGQALYAYTQGSAYAEFAEKSKGKLVPGYDADFILVDRDLDRVRAPGLLGTHVLETFVAGRQVFVTNMHIR